MASGADAFRRSPPGTLALFRRDGWGPEHRGVLILRCEGDNYRDLFWCDVGTDNQWEACIGQHAVSLDAGPDGDSTITILTEGHPLYDEACQLAAEWALTYSGD